MITSCTTSESEPYHLPGSSVNPKTRSGETQQHITSQDEQHTDQYIYQLESQPLKSYLSKILNKTKREAKIIDSVGNAVRLVACTRRGSSTCQPMRD